MKPVQYTAPGLYYEAITPVAEPSPLRSDVAGFVGRTWRGPVGVAMRVTGWRECELIFGGLQPDANTPIALQGYFDNGGDVAYVVRLLGPAPADDPDEIVACATWDLTRPSGASEPLQDWNPLNAGFQAVTLKIMASSPGAWANGLRVSPRFRQQGASGNAEIDLVVHAAREAAEYLIGIDPGDIVDQVARRSRLIRIVEPEAGSIGKAPAAQPRLLRWQDILLSGGSDPPVSAELYQAGLQSLRDEPEVALVALPDLPGDLPSDQVTAIQYEALLQGDLAHDRVVLLDLPSADLDGPGAVSWSKAIRGAGLGDALRSAVAYHPWLSVQDPFGGTARPLRSIPPCGHVAGVISRLDRERGAQYTPANVTMADVMDVTGVYNLAERAALNEAGVNVLRCISGQGIQIWGGRTLYPDPFKQEPGKQFIAHRRLIHRLVRAIRRVAEPLVFESNGPALWLALTRAITTVLVEAYRAGGLKGSRPDEAFLVHCDATNNSPDAVDRGEVLCEIQVAPAVPMEFITLRVSVSAAGSLDVFEK
ncbi:hypothetical protein LMG28614_00716 [Paraburkholderia ultramafica]|uniref:Phage tail protein n=1 Tax=Paraburkholderia ultramafica TaxID=1544867 RepID=A0A6S7AXH2_9BURK|nr:phage tail sheath subtilisin-like domain-containing protein [Paraburkholderia ultramafica]CAB3778754.1 hypothetical protein LMG28614_00716 [Paraburkholderia ultramafica]